MTNLQWMAMLVVLGSACGVETDDQSDQSDQSAQSAQSDPSDQSAQSAQSDPSDQSDQVDEEAEVGERFAYTPMAFARVTALGGIVTHMNSANGAPGATTVSRSAVGSYRVTFTGFAAASGAGADGNVQVTAEGTTNVRCRLLASTGSSTVAIDVRCSTPTGAPADSPFAVLFHRYLQPRPNAFPTRAAYVLVTELGWVHDWSSYNSSGERNTVTRLGTGRYRVNIPNATAVNASMMLTNADADSICAIRSWGAFAATVECVDNTGTFVESAFSLSYSTSGPALDQQGGHAWFSSTTGAISPTFSRALGKFSCGTASLSSSLAGSLASVSVSGDLGAHDGAPFRRASFASAYGSPKYCKVESQSSSGSAPMSTGTANVRCYRLDGSVIETPTFTFTHVTSDANGPC